MIRRAAWLLLLGCAGTALAADPEPTLKDLKAAPPEIHAGETVKPDPARARELYRGFLRTEGGDPTLKTEALRRLGDLELDAGEAARGESAGPGAGDAETRAAIDAYTRLLAEQPVYPGADGVLYQLARAWEAEGDTDKALTVLDRLVKQYPGTRHYGEAQFRRGEILFSAQQWRAAEAAYRAVVAAGSTSEFYQQALYKLGWTLFKQSATEQSAAAFLNLLDTVLVDPRAEDGTVPLASLSRADREMVADSIRALSIQFASLDGARSLDAAVKAHGRPAYTWLLYSSLGDMLVEKERYTDAADTYRAFVRQDPAHRRAPDLQDRAIRAYLKGGFADLALEAKREFIRQYRFDGPFWRGRERTAAPEVVAELKSNLKDVARYQHALAQSTHKPEDFKAAADWYRQYLASFPDDPDSAATNYLLADALFEGRDYRRAAAEYERTAYDYAAGPQSAKAGFAALVCYDKVEPTLAGADRQAWHKAAIESSLRFAGTFPQDPEAGRVRLRAAQQLFNDKDYERAGSVATLAAMHQPPLASDQQRTAWNVVADSAFELGRYADAEAAYDEVIKRLPAGDPARQPINERLAAAVYKQGEAKQAAGDTAGAVGDFLRIGAVAGDSTIRATAEHDAAALLVREKQWQRAIQVLEAFRHGYPDSPLAADVPRNLALAYSEAGRPLDAAREFERIADTKSEADDVRHAALVEAARLYEQGGDMRGAARTWSAFVERYPRPLDEAMAARQKLADTARDAGDAAGRSHWLNEIVSADAAAGPARTDSSRSLAAHAALELAAPLGAAFDAIALKAPLKRSLKAKRAAMEKALKAFQAAADYGVADVTTAATFATAELYRRLAADLMASERPRNLKPDEMDQYEVLLEEQAYPFEERAIQLLEANVARASQGVYDQPVRGSFAALAALKPARYARQEVLPQPTPDGLLGAALAAAAAGDWNAAEPEFSKAAGAGGGAAALTGLGLAYRNTGRFKLAEQAYRSALQSDPGYGPAMLDLAVLLDLYLQQPANALPLYTAYQAARAEPDARVASWIKEVEIRTSHPVEGAGASP